VGLRELRRGEGARYEERSFRSAERRSWADDRGVRYRSTALDFHRPASLSSSLENPAATAVFAAPRRKE
jgi:hypothetical protein